MPDRLIPDVARGPARAARRHLIDATCRALRPLLTRLVRRVAARHPSLFERLGPHRRADYVIDARELPFALHLRPDPDAPLLQAVGRHRMPRHDATISGHLPTLVRLIDGEIDGNAAFFSRDLAISGDTGAVVSLRNALDDLDVSLAADIAEGFGPPGRAMLNAMRAGGTPQPRRIRKRRHAPG